MKARRSSPSTAGSRDAARIIRSDVLARLAAIDELHARKAEPLLVDLSCPRRPAREVHAADVGLVGHDASPRDELAAREDRADHLHVVLVQRARCTGRWR